MGLLLTHKRKVILWNDMLSVSLVGEGGRAGGGKRGKIKVFSKDSRYRLFRLLHQLSFERVTFLTLTYPNEYPTDSRVYKAHLKEFHRRFEVDHPGLQSVWRLEFQSRGAPHFHIMILDCPFIDVHDLCWTWKCVTHTYDLAHEIVGVDLKLVTDASQQALVATYLGKYIAKVDERTEENANKKCGRYWGKWNIAEPPQHEIEIVDWEAERLVTYVLSARMGGQGWRPIDPTLCTVFGDGLGGSQFSQLVRGYAAFFGLGNFREPS